MRRLFVVSSLLGSLVVGCDKPVPSEIVKPRHGAGSSNPGFADGSVVRDERDAGLDDAGEGDPAVENVAFSKVALIQAAADCALFRLSRLRDAAELLRDASAAWAKDRTEDNAAAARAAFRASLSRLQRVEAMKFGPAARSSSIGGKNLGDKLYTPFPSLDRCAIDRQLALGAYAATDVALLPARQRGLSAFEYLAYYVGPDNACPPAIDINANGTWAALGLDEIMQRRTDFAAAIAADVLSVSEEILVAWSARGDDFYGQITRPGQGLFRDAQSALNTVSNAMFHLEIEVKDAKLARILNRSGTACQAPTCPEALESPLSERSGQNLVDNLAGFRDLFQGCGAEHRGLGFDDWLEAVGAPEAGARTLAALDAADEAVAEVLLLEQALASDSARVARAYDAVKAVTDRLKGELPSILGIEPPAGLEGDND